MWWIAFFIFQAKVVCTTLSSSGLEVFASLNNDFDTVIIDEACQAVELSTLIPLKYKCTNCVLVGDPQQVASSPLCFGGGFECLADQSSYLCHLISVVA
jgi:superfamily I DNA and/or RNA helicase